MIWGQHTSWKEKAILGEEAPFPFGAARAGSQRHRGRARGAQDVGHRAPGPQWLLQGPCHPPVLVAPVPRFSCVTTDRLNDLSEPLSGAPVASFAHGLSEAPSVGEKWEEGRGLQPCTPGSFGQVSGQKEPPAPSSRLTRPPRHQLSSCILCLKKSSKCPIFLMGSAEHSLVQNSSCSESPPGCSVSA